jgi:hypothetical protein
LCQYTFANKLQSQTVIREKLSKALLYEKIARKMLMKLTPVRSNDCVDPTQRLELDLHRRIFAYKERYL